jgi:hypothetical protein
MTEDVKPEYETPPPDYDEGEAEDVIAEAVLNANSDFAAAETPIQDIPADEPVEPIWTRLRRMLLGGANRLDDAGFAERIRQLDEAIAFAPDTPANYVLRGELYLSAGEYALAQADFQRGYDLAVRDFERSDWGLIAQAMQDRAQAGLQKASQKLGTTNDSIAPGES